jgi:hypothetical protein
MTQFNDGVNIGTAGAAGIDSRGPIDQGSLPSSYQAGAAISPVYVYDIVPLTKFNNNLAASQVVSGASFTLAAGTGVTTSTINGTTYYVLDVPRALTASGVSVSTAEVLLTATGMDEFFQAQTATWSGPTGTATPTTTTKAFKYISSVTTPGNTASGLTIGTADIFGLPRRVDAFGYTVLNWNSTVITANTGFTAAVTTTPSATTGDVRGTYAVQSAADGTKRLTAFIFCKDPNTMDGLYGKVPA